MAIRSLRISKYIYIYIYMVQVQDRVKKAYIDVQVHRWSNESSKKRLERMIEIARGVGRIDITCLSYADDLVL